MSQQKLNPQIAYDQYEKLKRERRATLINVVMCLIATYLAYLLGIHPLAYIMAFIAGHQSGRIYQLGKEIETASWIVDYAERERDEPGS
jgi:biotin transporter BioY